MVSVPAIPADKLHCSATGILAFSRNTRRISWSRPTPITAMIAVFLVVTLIQGLVALYNFRAGFLLFVLMFSIYPRFLAVGVSEYGFALTAQRVMIATLLILFVLRWLHGTADIARGIDIFRKNRAITILLLGIPVSKLLGN